MNFERQKANMLAENIKDFIQFVDKSYQNKNSFRFNNDKLYQVKLIIEDFKFQIIADELLRINEFDWNEKYTHYLVSQFQKGINIIDEFVHNNNNDLFLLMARLHTLKSLSGAFNLQDNLTVV
ncbi:hypothetical protein [Neobacillus bataviensis]|uniref:hypothetical protein n=1 Tax=Neobacillus bataviensis TaxID=220685 RepID=UPI001CBB3AF8|nr:hypothetical protein [Neobacillus bataviensis]